MALGISPLTLLIFRTQKDFFGEEEKRPVFHEPLALKAIKAMGGREALACPKMSKSCREESFGLEVLVVVVFRHHHRSESRVTGDKTGFYWSWQVYGLY